MKAIGKTKFGPPDVLMLKEIEGRKMGKSRHFKVLGFAAAMILFISACADANDDLGDPDESKENIAGMPNPAAVYCEGLGYSMENVTRNGGEDADCIFPDGSRCGQWDFLSGRCGQEFSYCKIEGFALEEGANIGICQFTDGSTCDEFQFFCGECSAGDNPGVIEEEPAAEPGERKTFTNEKYGYSFDVPRSCYEGPLLGACKQSPPEERPEECLCFVNGANPDSVTFQDYTITSEEVSLATFSVLTSDTAVFSPPEGADLISHMQLEFSERYPEIPNEANMELGGFPALRISIPGSPGVADYQEIFFIKEDRLFKIYLIDTINESNMTIYDRILASFTFSK